MGTLGWLLATTKSSGRDVYHLQNLSRMVCTLSAAPRGTLLMASFDGPTCGTGLAPCSGCLARVGRRPRARPERSSPYRLLGVLGARREVVIGDDEAEDGNTERVDHRHQGRICVFGHLVGCFVEKGSESGRPGRLAKSSGKLSSVDFGAINV